MKAYTATEMHSCHHQPSDKEVTINVESGNNEKYTMFVFSDVGQSYIETSLFTCQIINMYGELIMEATQHKVSEGDLFFLAAQKNIEWYLQNIKSHCRSQKKCIGLFWEIIFRCLDILFNK